MERAFTHTPGPWEAPGLDAGEYIICASPKGKRRTLAHVHEQADLKIFTQANARRIVACVNACEGISTKALADGVLSLSDFNSDSYCTGIYAKQHSVLEAENARLRSALSQIAVETSRRMAKGGELEHFQDGNREAGNVARNALGRK